MGLLRRMGWGKKQPEAGQAAPAGGRSKLRIGLIGPGLIWRNKHRDELEQARGRATVMAVCARSEDSFAGAGLPAARRYATIESLLGDDKIETVLVLTPIGLNAPTTIAALRAGKDVIVEKPLGRSSEECRAVLQAEAESGKRVFVLEQAVYRADIALTQRLLSEGRIGNPVLFDRIDHFLMDADQHDAGGFGKAAWRQEGDFPLGTMFDAGIHGIAQLTQLFGVPESLVATGRKWREGFGDHDEVLIQFSFESGLRGIFSQSGALPTIHSGFNIRGSEGVIRPTGTSVLLTNMAEETEELPAQGNDMWERILSAHEGGPPVPYTSLSAAQDVAILEAVARAVDSGGRETVERILS